jgi:alpha-glucosidase
MISAPNASIFDRLRMPGNPVADPRSIVVAGQARFTLLTSRLLRLQWSPDGSFDDRASFAFPNRNAPPPAFQQQLAGDELVIDSGALQLRYRISNTPFSADNLSVGFQLDGEQQTWRPGMANPRNLRGTRRTLDNFDRAVSLREGLVSRDGWALFDDSDSARFNLADGWAEPRPAPGTQDWYFFGYGHDYAGAIGEYCRFGGAVPLVPRYMLGAWWSRYWAYSADDLKALVGDFRRHDLPLDVLVLDMDWHTEDSWTGYSWNRELFPDPPAFLEWVHEQDLRVTLNLHPALGVQSFEDAYPLFARAMGKDPAGGETIPLGVGDRRFMQAYFELLHHPLEEQGVDFWWMDWQQGETSEIPGLDPLPWLNHLHFQDSARRGQRPMLYSRWGGLGSHRYHIGFSGDTYAGWPALRAQPHFTATAANVGYGWWSHDIGGHFGACPPELYVRWVQFGALSPCLRLHSAKNPQAERRPWAFPAAAFNAAREAFQLRYRLLPYLYTAARRAADTGLALCRPLYYAYPGDEAAYAARDQYFLGDDLIAAPIIDPAEHNGLAPVDIWVPPGTWYDIQTGECYTGPRWLRRFGDLQRVPLLARAGAVIPLAEPVPHRAGSAIEQVTLLIVPGADGNSRLYEDDGLSTEYLQGNYEWTQFRISWQDDACRLHIGAAIGRCAGLPPQRNWRLRFLGIARPARLLIDGQEQSEWRYDEASAALELELVDCDRYRAIDVRLQDAAQAPQTVAEERNRAILLADMARLFQGVAGGRQGELLDVARDLAMPVRAAAIARLGGPFVRIVEFSAPEEATRRLGEVLVAAPADKQPCALQLRWTLYGIAGNDVREIELNDLREDQVLVCPFRFSDPEQAQHWEVSGSVTWHGVTVEFNRRSEVIAPGIPHWRVLVSPAGRNIDPTRLFVAEDPDVELYQSQIADMDSINEPFFARLHRKYAVALAAGAELEALAGVTVNSPVERKVQLYIVAPGDCELRLNDAAQPLNPVPPEHPLRETFRSFLPLLQSVPLTLRAGNNRLTLRLGKPPKPHWWYFCAGIADLEGELPADLRYT